jgi:DNA-binding GntR family transcriptional regulator
MMSVGAIADEKTHARSAERHARILDAIEAHNEDQARDAMIHAINEGFKHARGIVSKESDTP